MGRALGRPRLPAPLAVAFELSGDRSQRLWLDAGRRSACVTLFARDSPPAPAGEPTARDRHALLSLRKHAEGRRVTRLRREGRTVVLEAGGARLVLRLSGTPALTLVLDDAPVATLGDGPPAWPPPDPDGEAASSAPGPGADASPGVWLPAPLADCHDRDLAPVHAVALDGAAHGGILVPSASWREAVALYVSARRRGAGFDAAQKAALHAARRELRRLERLAAHLSQDLAGLPEAEDLRRQGEALLSAPQAVAAGASAADVPDPREAGRVVRIALDPRLSAPANADRLFARARRIDRARAQVAIRMQEAQSALAAARERERRALDARDAGDLERPDARGTEAGDGAGPRHYLTSRGLSILVGRGARENHRLTFALARPEDLWFHARDAPGAHVILRDSEGRAGADDLREAAEVAAFFSEARSEARVDVHATRRKHLRPARGGPGRVHVLHSDTIRVAPRDPEGRLRRRP